MAAANSRSRRESKRGGRSQVLTHVDAELLRAAAEVDRTLIAWALDLSPRERLRAASQAARTLARFRRVAP